MHSNRALAAAAAAFLLLTSLTSAQTVLVSSGTEIDGRLQQTISTKTAKDGDTFTMAEADTLFHKNPALHGAVIEGHVEGVVAASPTHKAAMNVFFDDIKMPDGSTAPLAVKLKNVGDMEPKTHHIRDIGLIVGGAVAGHIVSKKTGHKGGTIAGAAAGFALANSLKSDIVLKKGHLVRLITTSDVVPQGNAS